MSADNLLRLREWLTGVASATALSNGRRSWVVSPEDAIAEVERLRAEPEAADAEAPKGHLWLVQLASDTDEACAWERAFLPSPAGAPASGVEGDRRGGRDPGREASEQRGEVSGPAEAAGGEGLLRAGSAATSEVAPPTSVPESAVGAEIEAAIVEFANASMQPIPCNDEDVRWNAARDRLRALIARRVAEAEARGAATIETVIDGVIADRGVPERDCTLPLEDRVDNIIVELKNWRHEAATNEQRAVAARKVLRSVAARAVKAERERDSCCDDYQKEAQRAVEAEKERDEARAEVERLKERERLICEALGGVCDGGAYVNDITEKAKSLRAVNERLRDALIEVITIVGGGACKRTSTDFLCLAPKEVRSVVDRLRATKALVQRLTGGDHGK